MGLIGMARRAGAARGAYMAEQEAYHRQRQGMYDDMALGRYNMDQQKFQKYLEDRAIKNARDAETHQWAGETHQSNLKTDEERRNTLKKQGELHAAQTESVNSKTKREDEIYKNYTSPYNGLMLEWAKGRLDAQDQANEASELALDAAKENIAQAGTGTVGTRTSTRQVPGNPSPQGSGRQSQPGFGNMVTDAQINNIVKNATAGQMKDAFYKVYNASDKEITQKTGKSPDQLFEDANTEYKEHVMVNKEKSLSREEFFEKYYEKRYGFRPIHDLRAYMDAKNYKPSGLRDWYQDYGAYVPQLNSIRAFVNMPYGMDKYKRENPTIVGKQKQTVDDILLGFGGKYPREANIFIRDPQRVRYFMSEMAKASSAMERNKAARQAVENTLRKFPIPLPETNPTMDNSVPRKLPFSSDEDIGLPPLSKAEDDQMHRNKIFIDYLWDAIQNHGWDGDRARRYAEYRYRHEVRGER